MKDLNLIELTDLEKRYGKKKAANPSMPCSVRYFIQMYTEEGTKYARKIN